MPAGGSQGRDDVHIVVGPVIAAIKDRHFRFSGESTRCPNGVQGCFGSRVGKHHRIGARCCVTKFTAEFVLERAVHAEVPPFFDLCGECREYRSGSVTQKMRAVACGEVDEFIPVDVTNSCAQRGVDVDRVRDLNRLHDAHRENLARFFIQPLGCWRHGIEAFADSDVSGCGHGSFLSGTGKWVCVGRKNSCRRSCGAGTGEVA